MTSPAAAPGAAWRHAAPVLLVLVMGVGLAVATYPGVLVPDSLFQLQEARSGAYTDQHPPVMAWMWHQLLRITGAVGAIHLLHLAMYTLGFALLVQGLRRAGLQTQAWLAAALACFPLFVYYAQFLLKDWGMAGALVLAAGLVLRYRLAGQPRPVAASLLVVAALAYGTLLRLNAVFAFGPLTLLLVPSSGSWRAARVLAWSLAASAAALLAADVINHQVIGAERKDVSQQLQVFDLMGIQARTGDAAVWGTHAVPTSLVRDCYTPVWWDNFAAWGRCAPVRETIGLGADTYDPQAAAERAVLWRGAVLAHPLAYGMHRISHFNASVYFAVPSFHIRYKSPSGLHPGDSSEAADGAQLARKIRLDYLKRPAPAWPVVWLVLGACLLALPRREARTAVDGSAVRALALSGVMYSVAYLVVGVATEIRYHLWAMVAIGMAATLAWPAIGHELRSKSSWSRFSMLALAATVATGYAARLLDIPLPG